MRTFVGVRSANNLTRRMASAMLGREVSVRGKKNAIHGIVTTVLLEADVPKIVIRGAEYPLDRVLTIVPSGLTQIAVRA